MTLSSDKKHSETVSAVQIMNKVRVMLQDLTGQAPPLPTPEGLAEKIQELFGEEGAGLGFSQFNEILLLNGYDRVDASFFSFLATGSIEWHSEPQTIQSLRQLQESVVEFQKLALFRYGNVKYAFKMLSTNPELLEDDLYRKTQIDESEFHQRHPAVFSVDEIPGDETYLLGYLSLKILQERLKEDANNEEVKATLARLTEVRARGERNQQAYLASDHLDVYVATSMRKQHEYALTNEIISRIFHHSLLKPLNLRAFDPTQAYCKNRIDKGLTEGLMLIRAKCTVYLAQESDTFGKDSELASTLAQGKPVIAFVPDASPEFVESFIQILKRVNPNQDLKLLLLEQLQVFEPSLAWGDKTVRSWLDDPSKVACASLRTRLEAAMHCHYDKRAKILREDHPLGLKYTWIQALQMVCWLRVPWTIAQGLFVLS